jgi:replicative DNA helicase
MSAAPESSIQAEVFDQVSQAESLLIGALIQEPSISNETREIVLGCQFHDVDLGMVYDLLINSYDAGHPIADPFRLKSELTAIGLWDAIKSHNLAKWIGQAFAHSAVWYASEVKRFWLKREVEHLGQVVSLEASKTQDATSLLEYVTGKVDAIRHHLVEADVSFDSALHDTSREIQEACTRGTPMGLPSGFPSIDEHTGGFYAGALTILAARPSVGKSALALEIAMRIAERGRGVMLVSLEMTGKDLSYRCYSRALGVSIKILQNGLLNGTQQCDLITAKEQLKKLPIKLLATSNVTVGKIRAKAKILQAKDDIKLVVVDYLGLVNATVNSAKLSVYERTTAVSRELKQMAMALQIPVLCLAQLNRDVEKNNRKPRLSDLRDSGAIEQDADNVWFLHRETLDAPQADLIFAKQRQGQIGSIELGFDGQKMAFSDSSDAQPWEA